jgi:aspartyl-tRNA(Asn)/glutamyl-tRNA(Gln) amidotransferase subunit C
MNQIDTETFAHLVELAALELNTEEAEYLRRELNQQLKVIDELAAIPMDETIPIAAHGTPFPPERSMPPRPDEISPSPDVEGVVDQFPENNDRYVVVPDIPHTNLE